MQIVGLIFHNLLKSYNRNNRTKIKQILYTNYYSRIRVLFKLFKLLDLEFHFL